jgi:hypothetical protein
MPGEVSRQQVACFFPVASHSWLGAALVSDLQPSALWLHMRVLAQKMRNITDAASCPIAQRKECFSPQVCCLRDQRLQKSALLI